MKYSHFFGLFICFFITGCSFFAPTQESLEHLIRLEDEKLEQNSVSLPTDEQIKIYDLLDLLVRESPESFETYYQSKKNLLHEDAHFYLYTQAFTHGSLPAIAFFQREGVPFTPKMKRQFLTEKSLRRLYHQMDLKVSIPLSFDIWRVRIAIGTSATQKFTFNKINHYLSVFDSDVQALLRPDLEEIILNKQ